jgi:hypothetical protein
MLPGQSSACNTCSWRVPAVDQIGGPPISGQGGSHKEAYRQGLVLAVLLSPLDLVTATLAEALGMGKRSRSVACWDKPIPYSRPKLTSMGIARILAVFLDLGLCWNAKVFWCAGGLDRPLILPSNLDDRCGGSCPCHEVTTQQP